MAKRRGGNAEMNLDSLLDTLTNVVGVLVMVLMLTTLNVQQAVQRIFDLDPSQFNITDADLAKVKKEAEQVSQRRDELEKKVTNTSAAGPTENFGLLMQEVQRLKLQKPVEVIPKEKVDDANKKVDEQETKSKELTEKLVSIESELARLKALLETTEVVAAPPAKIVSLPNPRDAPEGAKQYKVIVRDGQVVPFVTTKIRANCKKQVEVLLRNPGLKTKSGEIDCEKLVNEFNKRSSVYDPNFKVQLTVNNFNLYVVYDLRPTGGETAAQVIKGGSLFRRGLIGLKKEHGDKFYLQFMVWNNSFDDYVAARSVCDELDVLAGWLPYTQDYVLQEGLGISVACEGKPPPPKPDPNAPSKPTGPPPPPVPNDVVD